MGLEVGTYVNDLQPANPLSTDRKGQGDDHLRLLKTTLKNTFPNADRPLLFPILTGYAADTAIPSSHDGSVVYGSGAITFTLPNTAGLRQGWSVGIVKNGYTTNPVFVIPPSGAFSNGLTRARLSVPFEQNIFVWDGSNFTRLLPSVQAGILLPYAGATVPFGFAFPVGQSLVRADYPELFQAWGTTWGAADGTHFNAPDPRDRFLTGAGSSYALAATGGEATHTLLTAEIPSHSHTITQNAHDHAITSGTTGNLQVGADTATGTSPAGSGAAPDVSPANADITINNAGGGGAHENRPPYLAMNFIFRLC
jgi:microcystin-dependent protein